MYITNSPFPIASSNSDLVYTLTESTSINGWYVADIDNGTLANNPAILGVKSAVVTDSPPTTISLVVKFIT